MKKLNFYLLMLLLASSYSCGEKPNLSTEEASIRQLDFAVTGGHDGRRLVNRPDRTTVAIAKGAWLDTVCSGTTIGISHVITAAHCVYDMQTKKLKKDLTVVPSLHMAGNQKPSPRFFINKVFILKDFIQDVGYNGYTTYGASKDIAVLQVLEYESNDYYYEDHSHRIKIVDSSEFQLKGEKLSLIGYTGGGNGTLDNSQYAQHFTCETKGRRHQYTAFSHDCDTTAGASGMGIIAEDSQGRGILIGVHTGEAGSSAGLNSAAFFNTDVVNEIKNKITYFDTNGLTKFQVFDYADETNDESYIGYQIRNNCSERATVTIYYKHINGTNYIADPIELSPGQLKIFGSKTNDRNIKYHAKLASGRVINNYDVRYNYRGSSVPFQTLHFPNKFTDNELVLCQ